MLRQLTRVFGPSLYSLAGRAVALVRQEAPTSLFWSVYYPPNFGEWVGPYLFFKLTRREPYFRLPDNLSMHTVYVTAGSILSLVQSNCVVWGSGIFHRKLEFPRPWRTHAVRGPHTRRRFLELGYECPEVYGDPGILLPQVYQPRIEKKYDLGIVPHFRDFPEVSGWYRDHPGVTVVDVRQPIEQVVDEIVACRCTISSSLHGIITSHAYGVPSAWARFSDRIGGDGVKYEDYFAAGGVSEIAPIEVSAAIEPARLEDAAMNAARPKLEPLRVPLLEACPFLQPGHLPLAPEQVPLQWRVPSY